MTVIEAFAASLPFTLTAYQRRALEVLFDSDASLIVVAPTGAGKSVVADAALWQALSTGGRAIYTSPLRALANQRFAQIEARWGNDAGLVTGDTVIRPHARVRVMTAEVYRILALSPAEQEGGKSGWPPSVAIFDETHYISDPERGTVWEEGLLATPAATRIVCLSATVGDPERLAGWLKWLGRDIRLIEERRRPVPLRHFLAHKGELHLVLDEDGNRHGSFPFAGGWALARRRPSHLRGGPMAKRAKPPPPSNLPDVPPAEWVRREAIDALRLLRARALVPAIAYVSARREAELLAAAARAAFPEEADGVAFHHAGLEPAERRRVETALARGERWLVCATTTLSAGMDVPARSVLVTSFGRFDGKQFALFTPAEYAQLAGRAGRLGKDDLGTVALLANPWHGFDEAFKKLTAPLPPVESAFRASYPTALAWWGAQALKAGGADALARMLASTFEAYLRKSKGGRARLTSAGEADGPSVLRARATGRLLVADGLADGEGELTRRGRFVLRAGGAWEGRLLLRLVEGAAVEPERRLELLASLAEGPREGSVVLSALRAAHAEQVVRERECGARLTPALVEVRSEDPWRRRQAALDFLERAQRAARASGAGAGLLEWTGSEEGQA